MEYDPHHRYKNNEYNGQSDGVLYMRYKLKNLFSMLRIPGQYFFFQFYRVEDMRLVEFYFILNQHIIHLQDFEPKIKVDK